MNMEVSLSQIPEINTAKKTEVGDCSLQEPLSHNQMKSQPKRPLSCNLEEYSKCNNAVLKQDSIASLSKNSNGDPSDDSDFVSDISQDFSNNYFHVGSKKSKVNIHNGREYEYMRAKLLFEYRQEVAKCYKKLHSLKLKSLSKNVNLALQRCCTISLPARINTVKNAIEKQDKQICFDISNLDTEVSPEEDILNENIKFITRYMKFQNESVYKIFKMRQGHMEGIHQRILLVLTSHALYLLSDEHPLKKMLDYIPYSDVVICIIGRSLNWFSIQRNSTKKLNYIHVESGDSNITNEVLKFLEIAIRRRINTLILQKNPADFKNRYSGNFWKDIQEEKKFLSPYIIQEQLVPQFLEFKQEYRFIEQELQCLLGSKTQIKIYGSWLVFWENGSLLCSEKQTDFGPRLEGHLMTRCKSVTWRPAFFILKAGVLYEFSDSSERLPASMIMIDQCNGCARLPPTQRPHAFQLLRKKKPPILFAAADDIIASEWLQAFLTLINNTEIRIQEHALLPCQILVTNIGLVLCQRYDLLKYAIHDEIKIFDQLKLQKSQRKHSIQFVPQDLLSYQASKDVSQSFANSIIQVPRSGSNSPLLTRRVIKKNNPSVVGYQRTKVTAVDVPLQLESQIRPKLEASAKTLKVLSIGNMDQIAEVCYDDRCPEACLLEYECSEAIEVVGDWAIYFRTADQLEGFFNCLSDLWKKLAFKVSPELKDFSSVIKNSPSYSIYQFLSKGTRVSRCLWEGH